MLLQTERLKNYTLRCLDNRFLNVAVIKMAPDKETLSHDGTFQT